MIALKIQVKDTLTPELKKTAAALKPRVLRKTRRALAHYWADLFRDTVLRSAVRAERGIRWPRRTQNYPWRPLNKTGRMARAWRIVDRGASTGVLNTTDYAPFQNFGTATLPARPFAVLNRRDRDLARYFFERTIFRRVRRRQGKWARIWDQYKPAR